MKLKLLLGVGIAALLLAATGLLPIGFAQRGVVGDPTSVPDALMMVQWGPGSTTTHQFVTQRRVVRLDPHDLSAQPLVDGAEQPVISPDGRDLYFVQFMRDGDSVDINLVSLSSRDSTLEWTTHLASVAVTDLDRNDDADTANAALAITDDRLYVGRASARDAPVEIIVLDRASGAEQARWQVDIGQPVSTVNLLADAANGVLRVLSVQPGPYGPSSGPPIGLVRVALADGSVLARSAAQHVGQAGLLAYNALPLPDGRGVFGVSAFEGVDQARVYFLDLSDASVQQLEVNTSVSDGVQFAPREWVISSDGTQVYVFAPLSGELTVVDLAQRQVIQHSVVELPATAPSAASDVWSTFGSLLSGSTADAKVPITDRMQISPDGRYLYAAGARLNGKDIAGDGVWRIDTAALRIDARWLAGTEPLRLLMSADGHTLYTQDGQSSFAHMVDATTGAERVAARLPNGMLFTVADLYRDRYARPLL